MKRAVIVFFILICEGMYAQNPLYDQNNNSIFYFKSDKLYKCDLVINQPIEVEDGKCINEKEILPGSEEYERFKRLTKFLNPHHAMVNANYPYHLPYKKGEFYKIIQGYNGSFSHINKNALDFEMPEKTEIAAIRDGIVTKTVDHNDRGCPSQECSKYNNYILIQHEDGSFAGYHHLSKNGSFVKQGDLVNKGDIIGRSGNTGFSSTPHLHLECYIFLKSRKESIKTLFRTGNGKKIEYLYEGNNYSKEY